MKPQHIIVMIAGASRDDAKDLMPLAREESQRKEGSLANLSQDAHKETNHSV
jgi:hypothetical protein